MEKFVFQKSRNGWCFARHIEKNIFLFGPNLEDVQLQAEQAEEFFDQAVAELGPQTWEMLQVA